MFFHQILKVRQVWCVDEVDSPFMFSYIVFANIRCTEEQKGNSMERMVKVHIEKLPEGLYLATSDDVQGLVAQGRTLTEVLEIARNVCRKLLKAQLGNGDPIRLEPVSESFDYPLIVAS